MKPAWRGHGSPLPHLDGHSRPLHAALSRRQTLTAGETHPEPKRCKLPLPNTAQVDEGSNTQHPRSVASDIAYQRTLLSNVVYAGHPGAGDRRWLLIDAGVTGMCARKIKESARLRFGHDARAFAIVLTHGHFDHIGAVEQLCREWDCPVFAHIDELPFLNGTRSYPRPDPWAGGMMSLLSPALPRGPSDLGNYLRALPLDGALPGMPGWRWIHTPGHTPGHVSLFRRADRLLVSGDAVITTRQESAYAALISQSPEMHGPPAYFTPDWESARRSVERLAELEPETVVSGHGHAMRGPAMRSALRLLAREFDQVAVPDSAKRHAAAQAH